MSAPRVEGNQVGGLIRQTGDTLKQLNDDKGTWEGVVKYICRWQNALWFSPRRNIARHPDFSALVCTDTQVLRLKPGLVCEITATYQGFFDPTHPEDPEKLPDYSEELVTGTSEAPIETHPKFVALIGGKKGAALNGAIFDDAGKFLGFAADSKYAGVESYLFPTTVYRKSTPTRARPTSLVDVGVIQNVPLSAPQGANWLLSSRTWARTGSFYTVSEEFMMSGPRGWDETIYTHN